MRLNYLLKIFIFFKNINQSFYYNNKICIQVPDLNIENVLPCPINYSIFNKRSNPCNIKKASMLHMHRIPMTKVVNLLQSIPENYFVFFDSNKFTYCNLQFVS